MTNILEGYLSQDELAGQLGKTPRTLARWEREQIGPPVTKIGKSPLYRAEGVTQWLIEKERKPARLRGRR